MFSEEEKSPSYGNHGPNSGSTLMAYNISEQGYSPALTMFGLESRRLSALVPGCRLMPAPTQGLLGRKTAQSSFFAPRRG